MTLGKFFAWLLCTALVGVASQFTDTSRPETSARQPMASTPQPRRTPVESDTRRLAKTEPAVAQMRIERVSITPTP